MKRALTVTAILLVVMYSTSGAVPPEDYTGVMKVDSVQAQPGESIGVKVWLNNNNIEISAMSLPLRFESPHLVLDSVSLVGSIWTSDFAGLYSIDNASKTARITVIPSDVVQPVPVVSFTDAQVAEIFFSLAHDAPPHTISLDSIYRDSVLPGNVHIITRVDISDNTGSLVYLPDYVRGQVEVMVTTSTNEEPGGLALPSEFQLSQNYPNPFNPSTVIEFALPAAGKARLEVFNILGQQVATLVDGRLQAGYHEVEFDASSQPSGIYFYRLTTEDGSATRKMVFVK